MPPKPKPARLWLKPGGPDREPVWIILDSGKHIATGCRASDRAGAESALERHLAAKARPVGQHHPSKLAIASVLAVYSADRVMTQARPKEALARVERLLDWWGGKACSDVTGKACRAYAAERGASAARRELEDLRAAMKHAAAEGILEFAPVVTLPEKSPPRARWLTRDELAALVWAAWSYREVQKGHPTGRRSRQHVARFILVAYYTGSRAGAVCAAQRAQFDLAGRAFYRRPEGEAETKKRRTPVPMQDRLCAHVERWWRNGIARKSLIEFNGRPILRVSKAFARAAKDAKLPGVTPHTLRHTAATHLMMAGADLDWAAKLLGMTRKTLEDNYWHFHPGHARHTADLLTRRKT